MSAPRKLDMRNERHVALAYLCGVNVDFISEGWKISQYTCRNIVGKYSLKWEDPLVEFYRRQKRGYGKSKNAAHLYLAFNGYESFPDASIVNLEREKIVYDAVEDDVFKPITKDIIHATHLDEILEGGKDKTRWESRLLLSVFGTDVLRAYDKALKLVKPLLYEKLFEFYMQDQKVSMDTVSYQVKKEIFERLRKGLLLVGNAEVVEYAKSLEKDNTFGDVCQRVLSTLSPREEKVLRMRFGIGRHDSTLEEVANSFDITRERIRQIEAKALRKLRHPSRAKPLIGVIDKE